MKPTAKEVAHAAGVSLSAVSRAFTPGSSLDAEKKKRILAAAAQVGYVSPARRTAEAIAAGTVTLVAGDLSNPFYPFVIETLAKQLQSKNRQLLVYALPSDVDVDAATPQIIASRPSAVIVTSTHFTSKMATACRQHGIRVILLNRIQRDARINAVACDNYAGGRDIAHYLLARGRRKIGFIGGLADTSTNFERARGFRERMHEEGRQIHVEADGAFDYRIAYAAAVALLTQRDPPDALFCCNDLMALAAIDAAREKGLSVPDDVAVVGFDDIPMAAWNSYRLTTIRQPVERMVQETLRLIEDFAGMAPDESATRILPGKLVIRASA
ncbi:MAG: substrate-binding domain-containing protein [Rhizobium sp.]